MINWLPFWACCLFFQAEPPKPSPETNPLGTLWVPSESAGYQRMDPMVYSPREGDLLFFTDEKWVRRVLFWFAGTGRPYHVGLVVRNAQGELCTLEARPHSENWVFILKLKERMESYHGSIWVRRLRKPLSQEQSETLTQFAITQQGKPFAFFRLAFEGTPLSVRRGLGHFVFAGPHTQKPNWFCSELTTAALIECGLFEGRGVWPNCVYPRDLFYDRTYRVNDLYEAPLLWSHSLENGPPPPRLVGLPRPEPIESLIPASRETPRLANKESPERPKPGLYTGREEAKPYQVNSVQEDEDESKRGNRGGIEAGMAPGNGSGDRGPNTGGVRIGTGSQGGFPTPRPLLP